MRQRFGASVAEIDGHDTWQRSTLLCALVGGRRASAPARDELERFVEARCPDGCCVRARPAAASRTFAAERPAVRLASAMATARMRRVNEVMREVIGDAIATELEDPRIGFVTVTAVDTSPDLRSARVYVSVLGDEAERERDARRPARRRTASCSRRSRARCG